MPEPGPFGETFFEASVLAMVGALFVNSCAGGWVESVCTVATHLFLLLLLLAILPPRRIVSFPSKRFGPSLPGCPLQDGAGLEGISCIAIDRGAAPLPSQLIAFYLLHSCTVLGALFSRVSLQIGSLFPEMHTRGNYVRLFDVNKVFKERRPCPLLHAQSRRIRFCRSIQN